MSIEEKIKNNSTDNKRDLISYLSQKAENHKNYKHYTKAYKIETILNNNTIYLSNGSNWNDLIDKKNFNSDESETINFGICLSFSKSESIAMWMLYSGNEGCMIDYDTKTIRAILDAKFVEMGNFVDGTFIPLKRFNRDLFDISIFDIVYYDFEKDRKKIGDVVYVKRSDETNKEFPKTKLDELTFNKKTLPWSYENECRLVVSIKKEVLGNDTGDTVAISFSEKLVEGLKKRTYDSPNSKANKYQESNLKNKINWDLCYGCEKGR